MANKKINRRFIKLISATLMAIFSLLVSFTGAYAWFSSVRQIGNTGDDFVVVGNASVRNIYIVPFLGEAYNEETGEYDYYAFDLANRTTAYDGEYNNSAASIMLNQYSLENPNHPILMLFEVDGISATIGFRTEYCFLGNNRDYILDAKLQTKALLNGYSKIAGKYYEVIQDESIDANTKPSSLYYYYYNEDTSSYVLENRTYASYTALNAIKSGLTADDDGKYYRVITDNTHGNISTIYKYNGSSEVFEMVWIDLGDSEKSQTNPLSSVVEFHHFTFSELTLGALENSQTVVAEHYNDATETFTYGNPATTNRQEATPETLNCMILPKEDILNNGSNKKSFSNFTSNETFNYHNEVVAFSGNVSSKHFVGIVVNYNSYALEYVFSNNLGHDALNSGLVFRCDWKTEF